MGSGSTVRSEASTGVCLGGSGTFVRSPRFNDMVIPLRWNLEDGSPTARSVVTSSRSPRFPMSSETSQGSTSQVYEWTKQGILPIKTFVNIWFWNGQIWQVVWARSGQIGNEPEQEAYGRAHETV